jgi:hypothetical protein
MKRTSRRPQKILLFSGRVAWDPDRGDKRLRRRGAMLLPRKRMGLLTSPLLQGCRCQRALCHRILRSRKKKPFVVFLECYQMY